MSKAFRGKYLITRHVEEAAGVFGLRIAAPEIAAAAAPGQFLNIYLPGGDMLLPRPLSIADSSGGEVKLLYAVTGKGTNALADIGAGELIEIMGPLGTGFFDYPGSPMEKGVFEKGKEPMSVLMIGGGVGLPPLHFAARRLRETLGGGVRIEAYLGFRQQPWYIFEVESFCDKTVYAAEAEALGAFRGNVMEMLEKTYRNGETVDLALACGPRPMLAAAAGWCAARRIPLRVSIEERMGCGYGACAGCIVRTRLLNDENKPQKGPRKPDAEGIIRKKVCAHGPVFWAEEVVWRQGSV